MFDAFKMVAFGINDTASPGTEPSQPGKNLPIWPPSCPPETSTLYPKPQGMTEVSFIIDGPSGETVESVTYQQASASQGIVTLHHLEYPDVIGGIKVTYESGHAFDLGTVSGAPMSTGVFFEPGDSINRVELFKVAFGLVNISFLCLDAKGRQFTTKALFDASTMRHGIRGTIARHVIDIFTRKYQLLYRRFKGPTREEDIPQGEVVGLWGFDMAERGLSIGLVIDQNNPN
ncbi:uncharacterized protein BO80DRAFT_484256 [Aspergillus ibericus CBS 121593]|uniref:Uncharacterized protein n=1 Tax=Aspergillus ibericus CBS 121593 TaxID=1448316 RepID=A0A395GLX1_9EURO|nr:hypothetical protein BO80DRAFT_484256 [Aspergillus ibericus CBS 121593]RAK96510.1 hypothetical protein BO80DRAFT_484256 [Aspergillus ibericus CBS 121593]